MLVDAFATHGNYLDHLEPVWRALAPAERGTFYVGSRQLAKLAAARGLDVVPGVPRHVGGPTLVAGHSDIFECHDSRPLVYLEHGAGQTYADHPWHPSYSGGKGRERVRLFLTLNDETAARERATYPSTPVVVVGSPRLDALADSIPAGIPPEPPTVALCWHWDCNLVPETRWAFPDWKAQLPALAQRYTVLGSGHPRGVLALAQWYEAHGIELVRDFAQVCARAHAVVVDNSSAGPEFAAVTGRPVVWVNAKRWRRDVDHGGRFWTWPQGQVQLDPGADLVAGVEQALQDSPAAQAGRAAMVEAVYPVRGQAAQLAVAAMREVLE